MASELVQTISLLYRMQSADIDQLDAELLARRKVIWRAVIEDEARLHGCDNARANDPAREDLAELKAMSREDAESIAATWNTNVSNKVQQLFSANPRGNRQYYFSNLERWAAQRNTWKSAQIALYTEQSTRFYTQNRFRVMNGLRGARYVYDGPAPVSQECIKRFAAGIVDEAYVQRHPTPAHLNCPHGWRVINPDDLGCDGMWLG